MKPMRWLRTQGPFRAGKRLPARVLLVALLASIAASTAHADCAGGDTLFLCTSVKGKRIELCDFGDRICYSFGTRVVVDTERANVTTTQWDGMGQYMTYSVEVPNLDYVYSISQGFNRMTEEHEEVSGVQVVHAGETLSFVQCDVRRKVISNLQDVDLAPTP